MPLTTLMWVVLWICKPGITGFDWFWLFLAWLLDVGGAASFGYANRDRYPDFGTVAVRAETVNSGTVATVFEPCRRRISSAAYSSAGCARGLTVA